ncbi:MAG: septal ring lytic transglycosylase RlpA family protein [Cytophagales bacterium]|nr:septal ring lytic transglycosylase RlpA family protein [Cytophagales bacterium]
MGKALFSSFVVFYISMGMCFSQDLGDERYGIASFYSEKFYGRKTANSEKLNKTKLTAAHKTYPFNTLVEVTNLSNKKSIIVRINDRGPYKKGRIIDLTDTGAKKLKLNKIGLVRVKVKIVGFEGEQMLIPYQHLSLNTNPKFSRKYYQKTRLKYKKKYRLKRNIKHKKYLKKRKIKKIKSRKKAPIKKTIHKKIKPKKKVATPIIPKKLLKNDRKTPEKK